MYSFVELGQNWSTKVMDINAKWKIIHKFLPINNCNYVCI